MAYAGVVGVATPTAGTNWETWGGKLDKSLQAWGRASGFYLEEYDGNFEAQLTAAIADQQAATDRNMPPIILPNAANLAATTPRQLYSGMKLIGLTVDGQKNPDIAAGNRSGPEISFGGSIGTGTSSWWRSPGSDVNNVIMSNFQMQGSQGSGAHQFLDYAGGGSMYPASFHSLSSNFLNGMIGSATRKALMTQVTFTGDWTINNCWGTPLGFGGSDLHFGPSMCNIGVSRSAAQTGDLTRYFWRIDSTEVTVSGKVYISTMNGWRGILISGDSNVEFRGGVFEGFKATRQIDGTNPSPGHLSGPGPGSQVKITGGNVAFFGTKIGQGMDNPDGSEGGLVDMSGGNVRMIGCNFYGANQATVPAVRQTGGRLWIYGAGYRQSTNVVPRLSTSADIYNGKLTVAKTSPVAQAIGDQADDVYMYDPGTSFCFMNDYSMRKV